MPWVPSAVATTEWGSIQVVIGGVDVTFWQDAPVKLGRIREREPFGWVDLELEFPQITPFVALPTWLVDGASVEVFQIPPSGPKKVMFEGQYVDVGDRVDTGSGDEEGDGGTFGTSVSCVGELFTANWFRKPPELNRPKADSVDIGNIIQRELNPTTRPQLRLLPVIKPGNVGVIYTQKGAWDMLLDGYIQDMLAIATSSGLPVPGEAVMGITTKPGGGGYWMVGTQGSILPFGDVQYGGSMLGIPLQEPASRIAVNSTGTGYWMAARDGGVFSFYVPFYGSLGQSGNPYDVIAIEAAADDAGYWLADEIGGVFAFGSAQYYGGLPEVGAPDLVADDKVVDLGRTPSGDGYFLLTEKGYVYAFGDASYAGGQEAAGKTFVAMSVRTASSYWLLADDGTVYGQGGAPTFSPNPVTPLNSAMSDIAGTGSGEGYLLVAQDGGVFAYGDATFHGSVPGGGGFDSQWTLMLNDGRQPEIRVKDTKTVHWTLACGAPGVDHDLHRDQTQTANVFWGEGTAPDNCHWRNTRYPNIRLGTAPIFNGSSLGIGSTHSDVQLWEVEMNARWSASVEVDGVFSASDSNECRRFQKQAGLVETGVIDASTWAATFQVGSNGGDLNGAFYWPLASDTRTEQFLYNPSGAVIGSNPAFDPTIIRRETHDNYGARVTKEEGTISAWARYRRESVPGWFGSITLLTDPVEGSRFDIRAGDNVLFKYHRGVDKLLHIAEVDKQIWDHQVVLQVDERARDFETFASHVSRYREGVDPANRIRRVWRNSKQTEDRRAVWDCESGGGVIPRHAIQANAWNVLRIPAAEAGTIVRSEFFTESTTARISVGVFDRPVTAAYLTGVSAEGPLGLTFDGDVYWDVFDQNTGLVQAWGEEGQAGGYFPNLESEGDDPTGKTVDDASWYYETENPPWLWVALWSEETTEIWGKLYPGVD